MRKITLFKTLLAVIAFFALTANSVLATTATLQLSSTNKFATTAGATLTGDGVTWTVTNTAGTVNGAWNSANYLGEQFGTSSTVWRGTISAPEISGATISQIDIRANTGGSATLAATVGTTSFSPSTISVTKNSSATDANLATYTFTGSASGAITITVSGTVAAFYLNRIVVTYSTGTPSSTDAPTYSVNGGTFTIAQSITLTSTTANAKIYYTLDGSTPDNTKTLYTGAIALNTTATTTIKAIAYDSNGANPSSVTSQTYVINLDPTITVGSASVPALYAQVGNTDTEIINVSGSNLTADISLAITGTNANQFSLSAATLAQTAGAVASSPITITYTPTAAGSHTATLTLSSAGAADKVFELTASAIWPPLTTPVASAATTVNNGGFTANWAVVSGATQYDVNVYTKSGTKLVENFDAYTTTVPTDWTFNSMAYYTSSSTGYFGAGANSLKFDATNDSIMSPTYAQPATAISFWLRGASTDANSALLFQGSTNGTNWVTIEDIKPIPTTATVKLYNSGSTPALASGYVKFRLKYTKSAGNTAFDDFTYMNNYVDVPVAGSPFTVNDPEVTKQVSGLSPETTYYYTVVAKNTNVTSSASNEISVTTSPVTGVENPTLQASVYGANGNIVLTATAGQKVEIFNSVGQRLLNITAVEGVNTIPVNVKGLVIVKAGNSLSKIVL